MNHLSTIRTYSLIERWAESPVDCHVFVRCQLEKKSFVFEFDVEESMSCFRLIHDHDGAECWEDSCVEVFLRSGVEPKRYFNFECNAGGHILAEEGAARQGRRRFSQAEYARIDRHAEILTKTPDHVHWRLTVAIPCDMIGVSSEEMLWGNLYKCASKAANIHYLSAFEVASPTPDFHRPESFQPIFSACASCARNSSSVQS